MTDQGADEPESVEEIKSDLNPLLNPVLEENLGRWAQVYFTNPPEKRERAVLDLLRELENRNEAGKAAPGDPIAAAAGTAGAEKIQCPICNRENRTEQRFCGFCGTPLREQARPVDQARPVNETAGGPESMSFLGLSSSLSSPSPAPGSSSSPAPDDVAFLRERSFEKGYYEPESGAHRGMYIVAALVILLGGIGYLTWPVLQTRLPAGWQIAPQARTVPSPPPSPAQPQSQQATPPQAAASEAPPPAAAPAPATLPAPPEKAESAAHRSTPADKTAALRDSSSRNVKLASDTQTSRAEAGGAHELLVAQRYLREGSTPAGRAEAARWLWKSVGKENPQATLLLADMYARGDGVSKSCDQARILLGTAAKKGSSEAAQKLRNLQSSGCR